MSAIRTTCPACKGEYITGVVGRTPFPPHECPLREAAAYAGAVLASLLVVAGTHPLLSEEMVAAMIEAEKMVRVALGIDEDAGASGRA